MLASALQSALTGWRHLFARNRRLCERDGVPLPPERLRAAGPLFRSDRSFVAYADADVDIIVRFANPARASILDFGCGIGRLYFGLTARTEPQRYLGLDVKPHVVAWASRHITPSNPRFEFRRLDVHNDRYNPDGQLDNGAWLATLDRSFDIIYCYSVLSHMIEDDAARVLDLFAERTSPNGFVFLTAFVGQQPDNIVINPQDRETSGPLHIVRYRRDYFVDVMLRRFAVAAEYPEAATDGQAIYVLTPCRPN